MSDWKNIRIRDLFACSTPGDWGTEGSPEDGIPVLRSTNFRNNGSIDYSDLAYRKVEDGRLKTRRIVNGTILIEKSGGSPTQPAGRVVLCDRDFNGTASNFIQVVTAKNDFCARYVAYLLYHLYQSGLVLKYQQQTTGIINFKLNEYAQEIVACTTSKPEQAKIAEILSTVDRAIEQTEALIAKQQRIKTGLMKDLLTRGIDEHGNLRSESTHKFQDSPLGRIPVEWEAKELRRYLSYLSYGFTNPMPEAIDGPFLITAANVMHGVIHYDTCRRTTLEAFTKLLTNKSRPQIGDILITKDGTLGRLAIVDRSPLCINQSVAVMRAKEAVDSEYLKLLLESAGYQQRILEDAGGSTIKHIYISKIDKMVIGLPRDKSEQEAIKERVLSQLQYQRQLEMGLNNLGRLKTGLMQDLLTGNKRVTPLLEPELTN